MSDVDTDPLPRAVRGDREALAELLRTYGPDVERTLRIDKTWRAQLDPADVMQVTYIEAFRHIRDFDPNRAESFPSWLRQMAENNLRDAIRGLSRQKRGGSVVGRNAPVDAAGELDLFLAVTISTPSRALRRDERCDQLQKAISRLPPDYAQVVRLLDLDARPVAEVAQAMHRSPGAVHMLRARAHDRLRELLGPASEFQTSS
ncbi:MAG TPA: sigma-70 family RNA polymerase sigma factor [Phycisphaerae bacterium]